MWILAAKLPNSDLKFAVDFGVDFIILFFPRKKAPKIPRKSHPGIWSAKFPSDFCRSLFLTKITGRKFLLFWDFCLGVQEPKTETPHPGPPLQGTPDPHKFFMFGASFPFRIQEKAYIKNFEGGGGWGPQIPFSWLSSRAFLHLRCNEHGVIFCQVECARTAF